MLGSKYKKDGTPVLHVHLGNLDDVLCYECAKELNTGNPDAIQILNDPERERKIQTCNGCGYIYFPPE